MFTVSMNNPPFNDSAQYTSKQDIDDIQYLTFLHMSRAGLRALEYYDPKAKKHQQAHMQARSVWFFW